MRGATLQRHLTQDNHTDDSPLRDSAAQFLQWGAGYGRVVAKNLHRNCRCVLPGTIPIRA